jgi:lycopene cyclase domain-containing protein
MGCGVEKSQITNGTGDVLLGECEAAAAILPVAAVFVLWDYLATAAGWWWFDDRYLTGVFLGPLPLEELMFFLVIPICGLLTFEAVRRLKPRWAPAATDVQVRR